MWTTIHVRRTKRLLSLLMNCKEWSFSWTRSCKSSSFKRIFNLCSCLSLLYLIRLVDVYPYSIWYVLLMSIPTLFDTSCWCLSLIYLIRLVDVYPYSIWYVCWCLSLLYLIRLVDVWVSVFSFLSYTLNLLLPFCIPLSIFS